MKQPARAVVLALIAFAVLAATLFGVLDDLPNWLRGLLQAAGTLAGIYLGSMLQYADQRTGLESVGDTAVSHLAAIAMSITLTIDHIGATRSAIVDGSPKSIAAIQTQIDSVLQGVDVQLRGVLTQAEAAARTWQPYSPNYSELTRGSDATPEGSVT